VRARAARLALRDSLCADNCLAVLLQLKPYTAEVPALVDAAHAVVMNHIAVVLKKPDWKEFNKKQDPEAAMAIMEDVALKQASSERRHRAGQRQRPPPRRAGISGGWLAVKP
jgi:RIO-like serine/threonine protein kinase